VAATLLVSSLSACVELTPGLDSYGVSDASYYQQPSYPQLVRVPGYPVYYDPYARSNYFFYDGLYWRYQRDNWYASSWYNGPWDAIGPAYVPYYLLRVPVRYYCVPPKYFRGWRADEPPRWDEHWGSDWRHHHQDWNRWDRNSVPAAAPLPVYQRDYSGDRYPRDRARQQAIVAQNYRYEPHEQVTREHLRQVRLQQQQQGQTVQATPALEQPVQSMPAVERPVKAVPALGQSVPAAPPVQSSPWGVKHGNTRPPKEQAAERSALATPREQSNTGQPQVQQPQGPSLTPRGQEPEQREHRRDRSERVPDAPAVTLQDHSPSPQEQRGHRDPERSAPVSPALTTPRVSAPVAAPPSSAPPQHQRPPAASPSDASQTRPSPPPGKNRAAPADTRGETPD
jgi:hypothetical protein